MEPIQDFSQALIAMKERVVDFNPYNEIILLQSTFFDFIFSETGDYYNILEEVSKSNYHYYNIASYFITVLQYVFTGQYLLA